MMPSYTLQFKAQGVKQRVASLDAPCANDAEQAIQRTHHIDPGTLDICRAEVEITDNPRSRQVRDTPEMIIH
jgi:hypothetical protein